MNLLTDEENIKELELKLLQKSPDNCNKQSALLLSSAINTSIPLPFSGMYDINFQNDFSCIMSAVADNPYEYLKRFIDGISLLGVRSKNGAILVPKNEMFILKTVKDIFDDLTHEAFIGLNFINKLRDRVPNFIHTYAAFTCDSPVFSTIPPPSKSSSSEPSSSESSSPKELIGLCARPVKNIKDINYIIIENVRKSITMQDFMESASPDDFLQVYLQVLNALNVAYKEFEYCHYDLHYNNVLIQQYNTPITIPLYLPNGVTKYIHSRFLARIIDYGMSHVKSNGQSFGAFGYEYCDIDPFGPKPAYDATKLLLYSYNASFNEDNTSQLTPMIDILYNFLNKNLRLSDRMALKLLDFEDFYHKFRDDTFPGYDMFIRFILNRFSPPFVKDSPEKLLQTICNNFSGKSCISQSEFDMIMYDKKYLCTTLIDYHFTSKLLSKLPQSSALYKLIITDFNKKDVNVLYEQDLKIFDPLIVKFLETDFSNPTATQKLYIYDCLSKFELWYRAISAFFRPIPERPSILVEALKRKSMKIESNTS